MSRAYLGDLHHDYRGTQAWAVGPEAYKLVTEEAQEISVKYKATVAKRTGKLAASAHVVPYQYKGGSLTAWVADVVADAVRPGKPPRSYAAPHEFGWVDEDGKVHKGGHEMRTILAHRALKPWGD